MKKHSELQTETDNSMDGLNLQKIKKIRKENTTEAEKNLTYYYDIDNETNVKLKSGGYMMGNMSSCIIKGEEYSRNTRGINIIVYNKKADKVINSRTFDTNSYSTELGWNLEKLLSDAENAGTPHEELPEMLQRLYQYNERCLEKKQPEEQVEPEEQTESENLTEWEEVTYWDDQTEY